MRKILLKTRVNNTYNLIDKIVNYYTQDTCTGCMYVVSNIGFFIVYSITGHFIRIRMQACAYC